MSETENNAQGQEVKICGIAKISMVLSIIWFILWFLIDQSVETHPHIPTLVLSDAKFYFLYAPIPSVLAVLALLRIKMSRQKLAGHKRAIFALILNFFVITVPIADYYSWRARRKSIQQVNLRSLNSAILIYSNDFDGKFPTEKRWCDLLLSHGYALPQQFLFKGSDVKIGESGYAFNKNLAGKKLSEVPADVVVLFETNFGKDEGGRLGLLGDQDLYKQMKNRGNGYGEGAGKQYASEKIYERRWNQVGGPEILTTENHNGKGCNVLFNDGRVEFIKTKHLDKLKWEAEENKLNLEAWSEGKAYMKTIAVAIRAYAADPKLNTKLPKDNDLGALGFEKYDQEGQYFKPKMFRFKVSSLKPLRFRITATNDALTPIEMTLDQDGNWTEVQSHK